MQSFGTSIMIVMPLTPATTDDLVTIIKHFFALPAKPSLLYFDNAPYPCKGILVVSYNSGIAVADQIYLLIVLYRL